MIRFSAFQSQRLIILLTLSFLLLLTDVFLNSSAHAMVLMPGGRFLSQAGSTEGEGAQTQAVLPQELFATEKKDSQAIIELYTGFNFRMDELNWNIAGNLGGTSPNILSELTWEELGIYELSVGFSSLVKQSVYFRGYMNYGRIISGENQDSDYGADDRQDEFSRSNNSADNGNTIDISLGAGLMLPIIKDIITITPLVGISYHRQNLTITDGYQTIPSQGSFPGLDSTYEAKWMGPWVGLEMAIDIETGWRVLPRFFPFVGFEYHWALFDATADWNLREKFDHPKSFEQEAEGTGMSLMVGLGAAFSERWSLAFSYTQQKWLAEEGTDTVFFSDGTYGETQLNEVNWESRALGMAIQYRF